ncbi:MAG: hypothetical protein AAF799_48520 [Myxococcota bacterium]
MSGEMLAAGSEEASAFDESTWVLPCTSMGCTGDPQLLVDNVPPEGFALDLDGHWLTKTSDDVHARIPGGDIAWAMATDLVHVFNERRSVLAVDNTGAILVGGEDEVIGGPPTVLKMVPVVR